MLLLAGMLASGLLIVTLAYCDSDTAATRAELQAALARRRAWQPRNLPRRAPPT